MTDDNLTPRSKAVIMVNEAKKLTQIQLLTVICKRRSAAVEIAIELQKSRIEALDDYDIKSGYENAVLIELKKI